MMLGGRWVCSGLALGWLWLALGWLWVGVGLALEMSPTEPDQARPSPAEPPTKVSSNLVVAIVGTENLVIVSREQHGARLQVRRRRACGKLSAGGCDGDSGTY